jgi:hypothetical protein
MNFSGCRRLATEISSSIASQCIPMPPPMISQCCRCCGVAARSRGNHTKGTETVRPSSNTTIRASSEHDTSTAKASLLSTKVGIPLLHEEFPILLHELPKCRQFVASETAARRQGHWIEPELRITPSVCHMNVRGLAILQTVKEKPVAANSEQCWHRISLLLGFPSEAARFFWRNRGTQVNILAISRGLQPGNSPSGGLTG